MHHAQSACCYLLDKTAAETQALQFFFNSKNRDQTRRYFVSTSLRVCLLQTNKQRVLLGSEEMKNDDRRMVFS